MRMLGGNFRFVPANAPLLVRLLPALVHIRREETGAFPPVLVLLRFPV